MPDRDQDFIDAVNGQSRTSLDPDLTPDGRAAPPPGTGTVYAKPPDRDQDFIDAVSGSGGGEPGSLTPQTDRAMRNAAAQITAANRYPGRDPSTLAAFAGGAARSVAPTAAFMGAFPFGAEAGAAIGAMTGPLAPAAIPLGSLIGGLVSGGAAAYGVSKAQSALAQQISPQGIFSPQVEAMQATEHPIATMVGSAAAFGKPNAVNVLRAGRTLATSEGRQAVVTLARQGAKALTPEKQQEVFNLLNVAQMGLLNSAYNIKDQLQSGNFSWNQLAAAAATGALFNEPWMFYPHPEAAAAKLPAAKPGGAAPGAAPPGVPPPGGAPGGVPGAPGAARNYEEWIKSRHAGTEIPAPPLAAPVSIEAPTATREIPGVKPYAVEPSTTQIQGRETPLGVEARPQGEVPQPGDRDYALRETQRREPGREVPQEPVSTRPSVAGAPPERAYEPAVERPPSPYFIQGSRGAYGIFDRRTKSVEPVTIRGDLEAAQQAKSNLDNDFFKKLAAEAGETVAEKTAEEVRAPDIATELERLHAQAADYNRRGQLAPVELNRRIRAEEARLRAEHEAELTAGAQEYQERGGQELLPAIKELGGINPDSPHFKDLGEAFQKSSKFTQGKFAKAVSGEKLNYGDLFRKDAPDDDRIVMGLRAKGFDVNDPGHLADMLDSRLRSPTRKLWGMEARGQAMEEPSYLTPERAPKAPVYIYQTPEAEGWWRKAGELQDAYFATAPHTPERAAARKAFNAHQEQVVGQGTRFERVNADTGERQSAITPGLAENETRINQQPMAGEAEQAPSRLFGFRRREATQAAAPFAPGTEKPPEVLDRELENMSEEGAKTVSSTMDEDGIGEEEIEMGVDKPQMAALHSKDMYEKPIQQVAIKELVQNAFDAYKAAGVTNEHPGIIDITNDPKTREITVKDSGTGMDRNVIKEALFKIGGTFKPTRPEDSSGGNGLAKMSFFEGSETVHVETVKNGIKSVIDDTGQNIATGRFKIIGTRTSEPNGTTVKIKIPKSYIDPDGEEQQINFLSYPGSIPFFSDSVYDRSPLIGPVRIRVNGQFMDHLGATQKDWHKDNTFHFKWGDVEMYVDPKNADYPRTHVLSSGLYQFTIHAGQIYGGYGDPKFPHDVVLDVRSKVKPKHPDYPINMQREDFRGKRKADVEAMKSFLRRKATEQQLVKAQDTFKNLQQLPSVDPTKDLSPADLAKVRESISAKQEVKPYTPEKITRVEMGDRDVVLHYKGGRTEVVSREKYVKPETSTFKAEKEVDYEKTKLDVTQMDPTKPWLHNNTNVKYTDIKGAPELLAKLGNALTGFMREFGKIPDYQDYKRTDPGGWFGGISFDKDYAGLNMMNPFKAVWFNPGALPSSALTSPEAAAAATLHAFIHELTHANAREEGAGFTSELFANHSRMVASGVPTRLYEKALGNIYEKHWDAINQINDRLKDYNTKNAATSFKSASALGPEPGPAKRAGEGVPGVDAPADERLSQQRPTGPGRAEAPDRAAGAIGDILAGQIAAEKRGAPEAAPGAERPPGAAAPQPAAGVKTAQEAAAERQRQAQAGPVTKPETGAAPAATSLYPLSQQPRRPTGPQPPPVPTGPVAPLPPERTAELGRANTLIETQKDKPRPLTAEEHTALNKRENELNTQKDRIAANQRDAFQRGDQARIAENDVKYSETLDKLQDIRKAREGGQKAKQAVPLSSPSQFTLEKMLDDKQAIEKGRPLSFLEHGDVVAEYDKIKEKQDALQAYLHSPKATQFWENLGKQAEAYRTGKGKLETLMPLSKEHLAKAAEAKKAEDDWIDSLEKARRDKLTWWQKAPDFLIKWRRASVISGFHSLAKLFSASVEGTIILPAREAAGTVLKHLPIVSEVAKRAPREGYGFNTRAEAAAFGEMWKNLLSDFGKNIRGQKPDFESVFGSFQALPPELQNYVGFLHSALKSPLARNEWVRSLIHRTEFAARHGVDITDPLVHVVNGELAYEDSVFWRFQNKNVASKGYRMLLGVLERQGGFYGKAAAFGIKAELPVVQVPTNILARTFEGVFGGFSGGGRIVGTILGKGIENLSPKEADLIMRNLKTGSLGLALTALGVFAPQYFGGFYRPGQKRQPGELGFGQTRIPEGVPVLGGKVIPAWLQDNPFLILPQFGSTIRQIGDSYLRKRDEETAGYWYGLYETLWAALSSSPFVRESVEMAKSLDPRQGADVLGEHVRSILIPMFVQQIAQMTDPAEKRYPTGIKEHVMMGIPGLREQVPDVLPRPQQLGVRRRGVVPSVHTRGTGRR